MQPTEHRAIRYLLEDGPMTIGGLPNSEPPKPPVREAGVCRFNPWGGGTRAIYYYEPEHDPEEIVRVWIEKNPSLTDSRTPRQLVNLINDAGSEFKAVSNEIVRDVYDEDEYNRSFGGNNGGGDRDGSNAAYRIARDASPDDI